MIFKTQSPSKGKNKSTSYIGCFDANGNEDEGFSEGDVATGKVLSTFNLGTDTEDDKKINS